MFEGKTILGLIPARGGSKGLPDKNIRNFNNRPLIAWTIKQALACKDLDEVMVSTDSEDIARVGNQWGANVLIRPPALSDDNSDPIDVILHALKIYPHDYVMYLEPTSPLRDVADINTAIWMLCKHPTAEAIVSIVQMERHHMDFQVVLKEGFLHGEVSTARRQDLSKVYCPDGTIYMSKSQTLKEKRTFYHKGYGCTGSIRLDRCRQPWLSGERSKPG